MESFENKLNKKFQEIDSDIPTEFSWENLGEGIVSNVEIKKKKERKYIIIIPILLGFICLTTLGLYHINKQEDNSLTSSSNNYSESIKEVENTTDVIKPTEILSTENTSIAGNNNHDTDQVNIDNSTSDTKTIVQNTYESSNLKSIEFKNNQTSNLTSSMMSKPSVTKDNLTISQEEVNNLGAEGLQTNSDLLKKVDEKENILINDLNRSSVSAIQEGIVTSEKSFGRKPKIKDGKLSSLSIFLKNDSRTIQVKHSDATAYYSKFGNDDEMTEPSFKTSHHISIGGGGIMWRLSSENFNLEDFESTNPSWSTSLNYGFVLNKRFSINTGLSYGQYRSKLNNIFTKVDEHWDDNAIQNVHNVITNETYQVTGAVVRTTSHRHIVHHNTTNILSVPLQFNYIMPLSSKFYFGLGGGLKGNMIFSKRGKGITPFYPTEPVEYNAVSFNNIYFLQGNASIFSGYNVNDKMGIQVRFDYNPSLHSFEWLHEEKRRISDMGLSIGIQYNL